MAANNSNQKQVQAETISHINTEVLIIGAGVSGLFLALQCEQKHIPYRIVDHQSVLGMKWRLAGGAMGNMTNRIINTDHYVSNTPKEAKKILLSLFKAWQPNDVLNILHSYNIPFEEREYGQIFCTIPVKNLIEKIIAELSPANIYSNEKIISYFYSEQEQNGILTKLYTVKTEHYEIQAKKLVIATGSASYPQAGATDFALRLAKKWKHEFYPFIPALVPFILSNNNPLIGLEGISIPARLKILHNGTEKKDPCDVRSLLFTHTGISGPAVLAISCLWKAGDTLCIDFLPHTDLLALMHESANGKKQVKNLILPLLPDRLTYRLLPQNLADRKIAELSKKDRQLIASAFHNFQCIPNNTESFKKAEACLGGINLNSINQNLESKIHKNLFFAGECIDITGLLGGYNIHFALACAKKIADRL